jgi:LysM repeat protein
VLKQDTDCELARKFYDENSELAIHSTTHVPLRDPFPGGTAALEAEMFGARDFLNQTCGIPLEDLVGFRTPLLAHNPPVRAALSKAGFLYDSSIPEVWPGATSPNATARLWPYSMEYGIPQDCAYFEGSRCDESERYPGLWQFPLLELEQDGGQLVAVMDPGQQAEGGLGYGANVTGGLSADALEELLRTNFDFRCVLAGWWQVGSGWAVRQVASAALSLGNASCTGTGKMRVAVRNRQLCVAWHPITQSPPPTCSYNGNRAPFGLYIHTPWFNKDTIEGTNRFLEYALQLEGVYAVTARQVIEWMQDPVPISQMDDWLQCKQVNVTVVESLAGKKCQVHTVKSGETGGVVAGIYAVSLGDLAAVNPGTDLNVLAVGDTLNIPPWDASCQKPGSSKTDS